MKSSEERLSPIPSRKSAKRAGLALVVGMLCCLASPSGSTDDGVDTALVVSVDVSQSVDAERYKLQMEGIAQALEDPSVISAITSGPRGGILFSMVTWSDQANLAIGWRRIASAEDAANVAKIVRSLPKIGGEFTCLARMLRTVAVSILPSMRIHADRTVVDVSGDGIDNCSDLDTLHGERDAVLASGATINGLPILVSGENDIVGSSAYRAPGYGLRELSFAPDNEAATLDRWFRDHVIGGPEPFLLIAQGYRDFARALRQKFVTEISWVTPPVRVAK